MSLVFRNIGITGKPPLASDSNPVLSSLHSFLKAQGCTVHIDASLGGHTLLDLSTLDLLMTLGGDGSLLRAAHRIGPLSLPILGIHRGQLGFLTAIAPDSGWLGLQRMLEGAYREESRLMLTTCVEPEAPETWPSQSLNDVVLTPAHRAQMIRFSIFVDDVFVAQQRADGLIVSTPTGSTAYALSSGGPIVHPSLEALLLVPICPHTLTQRPILVPSNSHIRVDLDRTNTQEGLLSCDGCEALSLQPGQSFNIQRREPSIRLLQPKESSYYQTLREKLWWNLRP